MTTTANKEEDKGTRKLLFGEGDKWRSFLSGVFLGYGEKQVAAAFFNGEMESELQDLGCLDMFGLMKQDDDREKVMAEIDKV